MVVATDKPPLFLRMKAEIKAALEKAAKDDQRSLSVMTERIVAEWLRERGYLPKRQPKKRP